MEKYGPFLTIVALAGTAATTFWTLTRIFGTKYEGWRPPDQGLSGRLLTGVLAVSAGALFAAFMLITPSNKIMFLGLGILILVLFAFLIPLYQGQVNVHFYKKPAETSKDADGNDYVSKWLTIVGGRSLLPEAEKRKKESNVSNQELFSGTDPEPYDEDKLWDRADRQGVQMKMSYLLMGLLTCFNAGIILVLFSAQVYITGVRPGFSSEDLKKLESAVEKSQQPAKK